jgi:hypothetical protein
VRSILTLSLLFFFFSCAQTTSEKVSQAIDVALTYLSKDKCQDAIDLLEGAGRQPNNAIYLQVLASAYACRATYSEINFISEITNINTTGAGFLKSLSILSLSHETQADSSSYSDIKTALNILLNDDGVTQPSQTNRVTVFGARKAGDLGPQILFMSIVELGKFLNYYGNVDAAGNKGAGPGTSTCFVGYTAANPNTYINGGTNPGGACKSGQRVGNPDLSLAVGALSVTKRRMCEGLVLITNIIDIINNINLAGNSSTSQLASLASVVNTFKSQAIGFDATLSTLLSTTSQKQCESIVAVSADFDRLQYIYALLFETGLP